MKVIFIYDIDLEDEKSGQKRLNKVRKIARRYLTHVQKSVFEGELSLGKIAKLEQEVLEVVDKEKDCLIIYMIPDGVEIRRRLLTIVPDVTKNVL